MSYGAPAQLERILNGLRVSGTVTPGRLAILPPDADTRWIFDRTGDDALVYLSRAILDQVIEDGGDRDPPLMEIVPRFLIRELALERVAHQLLRGGPSATGGLAGGGGDGTGPGQALTYWPLTLTSAHPRGGRTPLRRAA